MGSAESQITGNSGTHVFVIIVRFFKFRQHCTMEATKFYCTKRIVSIWNSLSDDVVSAASVTAFKNRLLQFTVTFVIWFVFMFLCVYLSFPLIVFFSDSVSV